MRYDAARRWCEVWRALGFERGLHCETAYGFRWEAPRQLASLGISPRTMRRYERDGRAPRWYVLALIGMAYVRAHGVESLPPEVQAELVRGGAR